MQIVVTGIGTEVGKTVVSSILVEALYADYCKPYQSPDNGDEKTVASLISNPYSRFFSKFVDNQNLIIEGAGGVLSPLEEITPCEIYAKLDPLWIIVSRHYLGSINHTLLTAHFLKNHKVLGLIFVGDDEKKEDFILRKTGLKQIGKVQEESSLNKGVIRCYAKRFRPSLKKILKPYGIRLPKQKK